MPTPEKREVFISYARSTEAQAHQIGAVLRAQGYSVWWDEDLPAHRAYGDVIAERLKEAKAVVVIWSADAARSQWVRAEADAARQAGTLVQLSIDGATLPMPFNQIQCPVLTAWSGDRDSPGWRKVENSVAELVGREKAAEPSLSTPRVKQVSIGVLPLRMDRLVVVMVLVGIAVVMANRYWPNEIAEPQAELSTDQADNEAQALADPGSRLPDSIAVLPFVNMSNDPEQEFLGDGLAEELLNALARMGTLKVAARTSSFSFKGKDTTIQAVGNALDVDSVLEGSIRRSGARVRITAQLIDVTTGYHLWSETYDRELNDLFVIQDEITRRIMEALQAHLDKPGIAGGTVQAASIEPELYSRFLWARRVMQDETRESMEEAHREFLKITRDAPEYAPAWAMLANTWLELEQGDELGDIDPAQAWSSAQLAIDSALKLDPREAMALHAQGHLLAHQGRSEEALGMYRRALEFNPAQVESYLRMAALLFYDGKSDVAMEALQNAYRRDPLHPNVLWNMAHEQNLRNQRQAALDSLLRLYEVNARLARGLEVHLYRDLGDGARAVWLARRDLAEEPTDPERALSLARQLQWLGAHDDPAAQSLAENYVSLALLGRNEEALAAAAKAREASKDLWLRGNIDWRSRLALGDKEAALHSLWERWNGQVEKVFGRQFDFRDGIALAALLKHAGRHEDNREVLVHLEAHIGNQNAVWVGGQRMFRGYLAMLTDHIDTAVDLLQQEAATGTAGFGGFGTALPNFGTALPFPWLFEADPRLRAIAEQFDSNRLEQMLKLNDWEQQPVSLDHLRASYVADGEGW